MTFMDTISYDDFAKLEIRVGTILSAERIPDSDKLLRLEVDMGSETRQILAGIAQHIEDPTKLIGRQVPVLVNLKPRKMRGLESQGMMLAASDADDAPVLLHPEKPLPAGSQIF